MSSHLKAELAATCSTLGRMHKGEYLIEPECEESVKDLIRYLKRDGEGHDIRRYLGEAKVLQNDLVHVLKSCPEENGDLFDVTLRLLINLTTPALLFYGEEVPDEKMARNLYLSLVGYGQEYKMAFCDVDFWNKVCLKLTGLFETDWTERTADDGIQIERILMLLRNVLQVPADVEGEKRQEDDVTVHDKVLWALRQSQILELLLFVSSSTNEEQYYLNLLEVFSLILREQNPKLLARCDLRHSAAEKGRYSEELARVRESEKKSRNKYLNMRNFNATFVMKGVKSLSNNDIVCHRSLEKVHELEVGHKKTVKTRRNRIPVESERTERRSTFSVRLFLKEFCTEFLNGSFSHLMSVVKSKLDSGKSLANDQTYYFWALKFFLDFATASDSNIDLIKDVLSTESFHFVHTSMENAFEHLQAEKKKTVEWVRRIHLILKAYHSLLESLLWMDLSKNPLTRSISRELKSQIFYVVEYREMTLHLLLRCDFTKFSVSYLRDLIETAHLFVKLLEEYSKQTKPVVQKVTRRKRTKKKCQKRERVLETPVEKWEKIKDDVYDTLCGGGAFPEMPPFDAALDVPIDDQKGRAMKRIQRFLHEGRIGDGIGLLRSARQVWPENDHFGTDGLSVEDETMALQEICLADLGQIEGDDEKNESPPEENEDEDEEIEGFEDETRIRIVEQDFDIIEYKKRLVSKKTVEVCGVLLRNYKNNSDHTNHCAIKLLHRIGWECGMPALLFQASLFWTLLKILRDKSKTYNEINTFTLNLVRKFRKHASENPVVFLELLFWKDNNVALEIQHGYRPYEEKPKPRKNKSKGGTGGDEGKEIAKGKRMATKSKGKEGKQTSRKKMKKKMEEIREVLSEREEPECEYVGSLSRVLFENNSETNEDERVSESEGEEEQNAKPSEKLSTPAQNESEVEVDSEIQRMVLKRKRYWATDSGDEETTGGEGNDVSSEIWSSAASSKKRKRENGNASEDSVGSGRERSKRVRCIGSDSEEENHDSGDDEGPRRSKRPGGGKVGRRRLVIVDSDSDAEANPPEEK